LTAGLIAGGVLVSPAWAAPPPNDNRADAAVVTPPLSVSGTLVDATLEPGEGSECGASDASVWYRFAAPKRGAVIIQLEAAGEMDSTIAVYKKVRSKYNFVTCEETDSKGNATIDTDGLDPGGDYVIRVGRESGSVAAAFTLRVLVPSPPPVPPGKPLPNRTVRGSVDRLLNPGDAYSISMFEGRTMRLSLRTETCTALEVYAPGTRDFDGGFVAELDCGGFGLFTPTQTGRHYLVVRAGRSREKQTYRLRAAPARKDDTTPGIFIANNARVRGSVNGGIDSRDLYRFDVTRRSTLMLTVNGGPRLRLMTDTGRRLGGGEYIDRRVAAGRYFVAVQGEGKYTLRRVSRTITNSSVRFNGSRKATVSPGTAARLSLQVRPSVSGPGVMEVERLDPVDGWQFLRRYRVDVQAGRATVSFSPPSVGRYRVFGEFKGSQVAASSDAGSATLRVQGPLVD
jgi:hypothetical protein